MNTEEMMQEERNLFHKIQTLEEEIEALRVKQRELVRRKSMLSDKRLAIEMANTPVTRVTKRSADPVVAKALAFLDGLKQKAKKEVVENVEDSE